MGKLDIHALSNNEMYWPKIIPYKPELKALIDNGRVLYGDEKGECDYRLTWERSPAYYKFRDEVAKQLAHLPEPPVDADRPLEIHLGFIHISGYDQHNFVKATIDAITEYWKLQDRDVRYVTTETYWICDKYEEGKIFYRVQYFRPSNL
jgi:hypothetical protein